MDLRKLTYRLRETTTLQFTLREIHEVATRPKFWIGLVAITFLLVVIAPYDTDKTLNFAGLIGYWGIICVTTFFPAMFVSVFVSIALLKRGINDIAARFVGGLAAALPVYVIVTFINRIIVDLPDSHTDAVWIIYLQYTAISLVVVMLYYLISGTGAPNENAAASVDNNDGDPLMARIPIQKRGPIQHMSMQDHYIQVTTTRGTEMVLMRMSDAVAAMQDQPGLQIHRSHWVAKEAVSESRREGGKLYLQLKDGTTLPVSRTFAASVREAGLV